MTFRHLTFGRGPGADFTLDVATATCIGLLTLGLAMIAVDALRERDWTLAAFGLVGAVIAGTAAVAIARTTLPWEAS